MKNEQQPREVGSVIPFLGSELSSTSLSVTQADQSPLAQELHCLQRCGKSTGLGVRRSGFCLPLW